MKLRTKLTLFSIALIVIAVIASCAIMLAYTNQHAMESVTESGLSDFSIVCSSFEDKVSMALPEQGSVKRSLLINQFRDIPGANECTLRNADGFLSNNLGFDIEDMMHDADISSNGLIQHRIVHIDGEDYFLAHSTMNIGAEAYDISFARSISDVTQDIQALASRCIVAGLIITLASAILMWLIAFRSLRPIKQLQAGANELTAGNYEKRIKIKGRDELAELADDFNSMANAIETNIGELHETAERQQAFINGLSHEMKTPITSIMLSSETLLGRKVSDEEKNRSLERIYDQSKWLERLSQKLMALVMLNREIKKSYESVNKLLTAVNASTRNALQEKNITLTVNCSIDKLPMDFDLMRSALVNLVDNARKASESGQTIELLAVGNAIAVIDHGAGIPKEEIERVMEPFYMVDRSRSKKVGGVGLGLALVKQIVEAHGAQLFITSELGQGTTVRIVFDDLQW